jgi:predicted GNAT superfamily acetyltransferase
VQPDEIDAMLAINRECEAMLSPLTRGELERMIAIAYRARITDDRSAMLVAFDQSAAYGSPNFAWFRERYPRFVYVDRVAVLPQARGRGIARRFYEDLIEGARGDGHRIIACEIYSDPPNPQSDAFHAAFGFVEVGSAFVPAYGKTVRYLIREVHPQ